MMKYLASFLLFITLLSCEETMVNIPESDDIITDRTVLIEELTGVQCPNCPRGAVILESIVDRFENNVFIVGIHGKALADPIKDVSKYDFRNDFARDLEDFHLPFLGKPAATFNRQQFENELFKPVDNSDIWPSLVEKELLKDLTMTIDLDYTYNSAERRIDLTSNIVPLVDLDGEYRISVFVTQNNIIDAQEDQGVIIDEYLHKHVLRHMMTNFDGDPLGNDLVKDNEIIKSYSYTIPEDLYEISKEFEVVVAVHFNSTQDKHIEQSAGFKIKP